MQNLESIAISIAISITKFQKYCIILKYYNNYCKISKVLQDFAILLEPLLIMRGELREKKYTILCDPL